LSGDAQQQTSRVGASLLVITGLDPIRANIGQATRWEL
jgi:hypothetical protein